MATMTYWAIMDAVKSYYGDGDDRWIKIAKNGYLDPQAISILKQVPGVELTVNADRTKVLGWDYINPFAGEASAAAEINSNVQTGLYGRTSFDAPVPANATGTDVMKSGATISGTGRTLAAIGDKLSLGFAGVALGTKLGVAIDSALYSINPQWWDEHYPSINPATWSSLIPDNAAGNVVRSLLGVSEDGSSSTAYIDEKLLAYTYLTLLQNGAFAGSEDGTTGKPADTGTLDTDGIVFPIKLQTIAMLSGQVEGVQYTRIYESNTPLTSVWHLPDPSNGDTTTRAIAASLDDPGIYIDFTSTYGSGRQERFTSRRVTLNGKTFYYAVTGSTFAKTSTLSEEIPVLNTVDITKTNRISPDVVAYCMLFGELTPGQHPGIASNPEAGIHMDPSQVINPTTGQAVTPADDIDDVLQALKNAYPDLFAGTVYQDIPQEDGTTERITYVPVPYPNVDTDGHPVTDIRPGVDPQVDPQVTAEAQPTAAQHIVDSIVEPPAPPDTGEGETPEAIIPTGSASALYSIYNPSQAELSSFGAWLWSSDFVEQLKKLFNDPMQSIIGLHKVFVVPPIGGRSTIRVGYLDSQVGSNIVTGQYVTVNCGEVNVSEYFGNVLDYAPYTSVNLYLPFIGIQPLDVGDVMRGRVKVTYHVDVLTGACLAEVSVRRDAAGGTLYTFSGNAAVQYPISSGSYMGILSSIISVAGGIAGTVASGGAMAPLAMGAASGILSARTRVQHSGSFSGNAGAMGSRKPYLIITRPQSAVASDFSRYEGYPANHSTTLGKCSGYIRAKALHLEGVPATLSELEEIEGLLSSGIVI